VSERSEVLDRLRPSATLHIADSVAHLRLNRPQVRNALRAEDVALLHRLLDQVDDSAARAMALSGEGAAFCAGRDLSDSEPGSEDALAILTDTYNPQLRRVRSLAVPTFAAVHGACLGVGLGLALAAT
jgi:2-(1,2-epoxy-1,2-dihydrophenyl)acetyl-CoA isomerase